MDHRVKEITRVLEERGHQCDHAGGLGWELELSNGKPFHVRAHLAGDQLRLVALAKDRCGRWMLDRPDWSGAVANAQMPGGTKLGLLGASQDLALLIDVPLFGGTSWSERVVLACCDLERAWQYLPSHGEGPRARGQPHSDSELAQHHEAARGDGMTAGACVATAVAAGWMCHANDGRHVVDLATTDGLYQANIAQSGNRVRVTAQVTGSARLDPESQSAMGHLLLRASSSLTTIRGAGAHHDTLDLVRFESVLPPMPSTAEIDHALSALSIACDTYARELSVLADPRIAQAYLLHTALEVE